MTDLSVRRTIENHERGRERQIIANSVVLVEGALVGLQSGYLNHWANGANDHWLGLCIGGDDRANDGVLTGNTSDTPPPHGLVDTSGRVLMHLDSVGGTPTQAKTGDLVYAASSNPDDLTLTSTGSHPIGRLQYYRSATDVDVELFTPAEHMCQATA